MVEVQARFPGGDDALIKYFRNNFIYPARCKEEGILREKVSIQIKISAEGIVTYAEVLNPNYDCPEFAAESIRVMKKSPKWVPALINGKFVTSYRRVTIPIEITNK